MEVWNDLGTGKYYKFDTEQGQHSQSNRFGAALKKFEAYASGYPRPLSLTPLPLDNIYSVQPNKFDGYSQFPRPKMLPSLKNRNPIKISDEKKNNSSKAEEIKKPLKHLSFSAVYDKSITPPKVIQRLRRSSDISSMYTASIDDVKTEVYGKKYPKEIKTLIDLNEKLGNDKKNHRFYIPSEEKEERRKLKGFFMKNFSLNVELLSKEKSIRKLTNPSYFSKLDQMDAIDRKHLVKKKEQMLLRLRM